MSEAELEALLLEDLLLLHDRVVRVLREHACLQVLRRGDRVVHIGSDGHQVSKQLRRLGTVKRAFQNEYGTVQFDDRADRRCHDRIWAWNVVKLPPNVDESQFAGDDGNDGGEDPPIPGQRYYVVR